MQSSIYGYLTYFHEIVNKGSIAAAARKLEIAPPAVSNALKLLERHLGLPLFTRTTRKMELTEAGQRLFDSTKDMIRGLDLMMESVRDLAEKPAGRYGLLRLLFLIYCLSDRISPNFASAIPIFGWRFP